MDPPCCDVVGPLANEYGLVVVRIGVARKNWLLKVQQWGLGMVIVLQGFDLCAVPSNFPILHDSVPWGPLWVPELEAAIGYAQSLPPHPISVEQAPIKAVGDAASILDLASHVLHGIPRHLCLAELCIHHVSLHVCRRGLEIALVKLVWNVPSCNRGLRQAL